MTTATTTAEPVPLWRQFFPEYSSLVGARSRCSNPADRAYHYYGGRGIRVAPEWCGRGSFSRFLADMGPRPGPGYSLDRIDVNGDYAPGNCRWATPKEQMRNTRRTVFVTYGGQRFSLPELCEEFGANLDVVRARLRMGWPVGLALVAPVGIFTRGGWVWAGQLGQAKGKTERKK